MSNRDCSSARFQEPKVAALVSAENFLRIEARVTARRSLCGGFRSRGALLQFRLVDKKVDPALLSQSVQVATPLLAAAAQSTPIYLDEPEPSRRPTVAIAIVSVILATALGGMVAYLIFGEGSSAMW